MSQTLKAGLVEHLVIDDVMGKQFLSEHKSTLTKTWYLRNWRSYMTTIIIQNSFIIYALNNYQT